VALRVVLRPVLTLLLSSLGYLLSSLGYLLSSLGYLLSSLGYLLSLLLHMSSLIDKGQIPLRYLITDRSEAGRRPSVSWNLAYHLARC